MKQRIILIFLTLVLVPGVLAADNKIHTSIKYYQTLYTWENLDAGCGVQVTVEHSRIPIYIYASQDSIPSLRYGGQGIGYIGITGYGVGFKHEVGKGLFLKIQGGWYDPQAEIEGALIKWVADGNNGHAEALWIEQNQRLVPPAWSVRTFDYYRYELDPNFGFSISMSKLFHIYGNWSLGLDLGYRWLKFREAIYGSDGPYDPNNPGWEIFTDRDFSAAIFGVELRFVF